ncbi:hypothetical protein GQ602_005805 [Ophiocordyceps camponoti-floridani]|uniref:Uncharacterized protein n=1 Tax=Ophiocordyceps camponoti-floridani TaxID=2030778 RepID=A0A8H4Q3Y0_9HYPO|nr:hypothetical protein GQ602_005805 [Ophiocordyceps camponoti-floridani]
MKAVLAVVTLLASAAMAAPAGDVRPSKQKLAPPSKNDVDIINAGPSALGPQDRDKVFTPPRFWRTPNGVKLPPKKKLVFPGQRIEIAPARTLP